MAEILKIATAGMGSGMMTFVEEVEVLMDIMMTREAGVLIDTVLLMMKDILHLGMHPLVALLLNQNVVLRTVIVLLWSAFVQKFYLYLSMSLQ